MAVYQVRWDSGSSGWLAGGDGYGTAWVAIDVTGDWGGRWRKEGRG